MLNHWLRRLSTVGIVGISALAIGLMTLNPLAAQEAPTTPMRTITVIGTGNASGSPDLAVVELGVEIRSSNISEAVAQVNTQIAAIIEALVEAGAERENIQTVNFSVYQDSPGFMGGMEAQTVELSYVVSNIVRVSTPDTSALGTLIDAGLNAGANRIYGVSFSLQDQAALNNQALQNAVADATSRAEVLATAIGATLGEIQSVRELSGAGIAIGGGYAIQDSMSSTVISEGQLSVSTQVEVTFNLQ